MRIQILGNTVNVWLSANDTYNWAHKPGARWPCSQVSGKRLFAQFDAHGLTDVSLNGKECDIDSNEFNAVISDHLKGKLPQGHPVCAYFPDCVCKKG